MSEASASFDQAINQLIDGVDITDQKDTELKQIVKELVGTALATIEQKYGRDGEGKKPFHDASHTKEFIADASKMFQAVAAKFGLTGRDHLLLIMASAWHDVEQEKGPKVNEKESANQLLEKLSNNTNLSMEEKKQIDRLINVTVFNFADHSQNLSNPDSITDKHDVLERCMALADLAGLGDYDRQHWRGNRLAHELNAVSDPQKWFAGQLGFLGRQQQMLEKVYRGFPYEVLYFDINKNIELYTRLAANYQKLIDSNITPDQIMAKDKKTSDMVISQVS